MHIFYIFFSLLTLLFLYMRFEATFLETKKIRLCDNKDSLKVIHLSDIHINYLKVSPKKVYKIICKENPDIIIMTGDYIVTHRHIPKFISFVNEIKSNFPIYCCLGNHDYEAFKKSNDIDGLHNFIKQIQDLGIILLHNDSVIFEKNQKKYNLIGIGDIRYKKHDLAKAFCKCTEDSYKNIAFTHNPDLILELPKGKIDYLLCGHFHGGQIWLPFQLEFKLLRNEKLCKMGVSKGLHNINGINLYINRGLGNVFFPLRFLSRPEITIFNI